MDLKSKIKALRSSQSESSLPRMTLQRPVTIPEETTFQQPGTIPETTFQQPVRPPVGSILETLDKSNSNNNLNPLSRIKKQKLNTEEHTEEHPEEHTEEHTEEPSTSIPSTFTRNNSSRLNIINLSNNDNNNDILPRPPTPPSRKEIIDQETEIDQAKTNSIIKSILGTDPKQSMIDDVASITIILDKILFEPIIISEKYFNQNIIKEDILYISINIPFDLKDKDDIFYNLGKFYNPNENTSKSYKEYKINTDEFNDYIKVRYHDIFLKIINFQSKIYDSPDIDYSFWFNNNILFNLDQKAMQKYLNFLGDKINEEQKKYDFNFDITGGAINGGGQEGTPYINIKLPLVVGKNTSSLEKLLNTNTNKNDLINHTLRIFTKKITSYTSKAFFCWEFKNSIFRTQLLHTPEI
jgi:hypothetical protein